MREREHANRKMAVLKMPSANSTDSRERELAQWFAEQSGMMKKGKLSADKARKIGMFPIFGSNKKDT